MYNPFISKALVKENLKRNWPITALCFMYYFLSGPFSLMVGKYDEQYSYYTVRSLLTNSNFFFPFIQCAFPVVVAITIFNYLNKVNSVNVIHSQPYSRKKLYISNVLSGIILIAIPILLTSIIFMVIKKPTTSYGYAVDIFTVGNILNWTAIALIGSLFVYAISVLACMVCANGIVAFLTACGFNLLPLALVGSFEVFIMENYFGATGDSFETMIPNIHAVTKFILDPSALAMVVCLLIAIAILIASYYVYKIRKLERVGDAYVFTAVKHIIGFLFVYFFTLAFGIVFGDPWGPVAYVIGAVLGFIVGQMFSRKTFMIFDKDGLKNFIIYMVLICLILAGLFIDITGYENRVPKADNVKIVGFQSPIYDVKYGYSYTMTTFESKEAIKDIVEIHQTIVDNKEKAKNYDWEEDGNTWVYIDYELKDGSRITRDYNIPAGMIQDTQAFKDLVNCPENSKGLSNFLSVEPKNAELWVEYETKRLASTDKNSESVIDDFCSVKLEKKSDIEKLWSLVQKDIAADNYSDNDDYRGSVEFSTEMKFNNEKEARNFSKSCLYVMNYTDADPSKGLYRMRFYVNITGNMKNTCDWIENNVDFVQEYIRQ